MIYCTLESPIGTLVLAGQNDVLTQIGFPEGRMQRAPGTDWTHEPNAFPAARQQLAEYFSLISRK